jgi:hypothetical protein
MKSTTIKFPIEQDRDDDNINNRVHDFLVACVVDGDLILDTQGFMSLAIGNHTLTESYEDEDGMFDIFDVEIEGDDFSIDQINQWQDQFKQMLQ